MSVSRFARILHDLERDAHTAAANIGYIRAILNEEIVSQKLRLSFSGKALTIATDSVIRITALYCARSWEKNTDFISIEAVVAALPADCDILFQRQLEYPGLVAQEVLDQTAKRRQDFMNSLEVARSMPVHPHLRVMRSEWLAHRVEASRDRKKLVEQDIEVRDVMIKEIVECAEATVNLIGDLTCLWSGVSNPWPQRISRAEGDCREFWRILPKLRDVENL